MSEIQSPEHQLLSAGGEVLVGTTLAEIATVVHSDKLALPLMVVGGVLAVGGIRNAMRLVMQDIEESIITRSID